MGVTWELGALSWLQQGGPWATMTVFAGLGDELSVQAHSSHIPSTHLLAHPALLPKGLCRLPASDPGPGWVTGAGRTVSCSGTPG